MTDRVAALPMYAADRPALAAWWQALATALRAEGVAQVPAALAWPDDLHAHWRDPRLLLGQTCGYPLVTGLQASVQVVGAFRYTAPGCSGIDYRSELMARADDADTLAAFRGRTAAINGVDSHSGCNALRGVVAPLAVDGRFFGAWRVSGSHRESLALLQRGAADIAAIDCVSLAMLRRCEPESVAGLRVLGSTPPVPGLPLITAASTSDADLEALRRALAAVCVDPALAALRRLLLIGGFDVVLASTWQVVDETRVRAAGLAWD